MAEHRLRRSLIIKPSKQLVMEPPVSRIEAARITNANLPMLIHLNAMMVTASHPVRAAPPMPMRTVLPRGVSTMKARSNRLIPGNINTTANDLRSSNQLELGRSPIETIKMERNRSRLPTPLRSSTIKVRDVTSRQVRSTKPTGDLRSSQQLGTKS